MDNFPNSAEGVLDYGLLLTILDTYSADTESDEFFVVKNGIRILLQPKAAQTQVMII